MRNQRGFTLVELLLVVAILAILAILAIPRIVEAVETSRERVCDSNCRMLEEAINRFHADAIAQGLKEPECWPWVKGAWSGDAMCRDGCWNGSQVSDRFMRQFKDALECPYGGAYLLFFAVQDGRVTWRVECSLKAEGMARHEVQVVAP